MPKSAVYVETSIRVGIAKTRTDMESVLERTGPSIGGFQAGLLRIISARRFSMNSATASLRQQDRWLWRRKLLRRRSSGKLMQQPDGIHDGDAGQPGGDGCIRRWRRSAASHPPVSHLPELPTSGETRQQVLQHIRVIMLGCWDCMYPSLGHAA